jgi:Zn-dependent protease with chaperone function
MSIKQKLKMHFLCSAGILYFGFVIACIIAVIILLIALAINSGRAAGIKFLIKAGIPILIFGFALLRGFFSALFSELPEPEGILLDRRNSPEFFKFLENIRHKANCPKIHYVKINLDFNAFITEQPTLGILGWYKRYLVIGLPLMLVFSKDELAAVLGHECGHLSKSHGKSGVKIYRAKLIWERIASELRKEGKDTAFFIKGFLYKYIPALNDILFRIGKQKEYEADKIGASVSSKHMLASALVRTHLYNAHLDLSFWPEIYKLNLTQYDAPQDLFFIMEKSLQEPLDEDFKKALMESLLNYRSYPSSSHPSDIERIEALGVSVPEVTPLTTNSLRALFLDQADELIKICNQTWSNYVKENWRQNYKNATKLRTDLRDLNIMYKNNGLDQDQILERASIIESLEGSENALVAYTEAKSKYPENITIDYHIGRLMLENRKEEGIEILKKVMEKDCQLIPHCCFEAYNYYCYINQRDIAAEYYQYAVEFMMTNEEVKQERSSIKFSDVFLPHDLASKTVSDLVNTLSKYKEIKKAYIVIKSVELSNPFPIYIIGIKYKSGTFSKWKKIQSTLLESGLIPWEHWIVKLGGKNSELEYKMNQIPSSRIL